MRTQCVLKAVTRCVATPRLRSIVLQHNRYCDSAALGSVRTFNPRVLGSIPRRPTRSTSGDTDLRRCKTVHDDLVPSAPPPMAATTVRRVISRFASPGDEYLKALGELAYAVSSIEWTLLGDLHGLSAHLPPEMTTQNLAGRTTGAIATAFQKALPKIHDVETHHYIKTGTDALRRASTIRNHVLHARPATVDGRQVLYRWVIDDRHGTHAFPITDEWLTEALTELASLASKVSDARVRGS